MIFSCIHDHRAITLVAYHHGKFSLFGAPMIQNVHPTFRILREMLSLGFIKRLSKMTQLTLILGISGQSLFKFFHKVNESLIRIDVLSRLLTSIKCILIRHTLIIHQIWNANHSRSAHSSRTNHKCPFHWRHLSTLMYEFYTRHDFVLYANLVVRSIFDVYLFEVDAHFRKWKDGFNGVIDLEHPFDIHGSHLVDFHWRGKWAYEQSWDDLLEIHINGALLQLLSYILECFHLKNKFWNNL